MIDWSMVLCVGTMGTFAGYLLGTWTHLPELRQCWKNNGDLRSQLAKLEGRTEIVPGYVSPEFIQKLKDVGGCPDLIARLEKKSHV